MSAVTIFLLPLRRGGWEGVGVLPPPSTPSPLTGEEAMRVPDSKNGIYGYSSVSAAIAYFP